MKSRGGKPFKDLVVVAGPRYFNGTALDGVKHSHEVIVLRDTRVQIQREVGSLASAEVEQSAGLWLRLTKKIILLAVHARVVEISASELERGEIDRNKFLVRRPANE